MVSHTPFHAVRSPDFIMTGGEFNDGSALDVGVSNSGADRHRNLGGVINFGQVAVGVLNIETRREGGTVGGIEDLDVDRTDSFALPIRNGKQFDFTDGDVITDRWSRVADDGSSEEVEEVSWIMVKRLQTHED